MFEESFRGLADLVLPGTSYLERDGTTVNLEGRLQRQRRAVIAPCPDELAWIAKLAERFGVELSPHASLVFDEVSASCYGGISFGEVGEQAPLPAPRRAAHRRVATPRDEAASPTGKGLRLADLPAALLRPGGRAHARARLPAPRRRGRARPRRRARRGRSPTATPVHGQLERHLASRCAPGSRATCRPAPSASRAPTPAGLHELVEVTQVTHRTSPGGSR